MSGFVSEAKRIADWIFEALLFVTVLAVFVPFVPNMPSEGLDPSWVHAMNQAVEQGLIFGRDIIFTFGPYASVYTKTFHPATDHLMMWSSIYLGLSFYVAANLNFKRSSWLLKWLLLAVLASVMYSRDTLIFYYSLLVGVCVVRLTSLEGEQISDAKARRALLVLLFAPFGLLPLIKGTAFIVCSAIVFFSTLLLGKNRDWGSVFIIILTPIVSLILFWLAANQPLAALSMYFTSMLPIVAGYTEAMAIEGNSKEIGFYIVGSALVLWVVAVGTKAELFNRAVAVLIFFVVCFLAFKAGFVRHDRHAIISGTIMAVSALLAGAITSKIWTKLYLIPAAFIWLYIDSIHIKTSSEALLLNTYSTYSNAWNGLRSRISDKGKLKGDFVERMASINSREGFPVRDGTTDIYSYNQSYLISSGNKWRPRPVFQSYSVYTPELVMKNVAHLQGEGRPDNIILNIQPIDGRLPSLEDGASWLMILANYKPELIKGEYLFLSERELKRGLTRTPIYKNAYKFGDQINLPASDRPLFLSINIKQTVFGRMLNTVFKPNQLEIRVTMENGAKKSYRLISGMAKTGFVISPHIESAEEFGLLYAGFGYLADKRVSSISIEPRGSLRPWQNDFALELFSLDFHQVDGAVDLYNFSRPEELDKSVEVYAAARCDGSIDYVNGMSPATSVGRMGHLLNVNGWLAKSAEKGVLPEQVYLTLSGLNNTWYLVETKPTSRPDVGAYFKKTQLDASGYKVSADVTGLEGEYKLGLAYLEEHSIYTCPQFAIPITIAAESP